MQRPLDREVLDDVELEYELQATGQPVVLIHPAHFSDWFEPVPAAHTSRTFVL